MPPKKRPLKKAESTEDAESVEEAGAPPSNNKRAKKNDIEKQIEVKVNVEPKEKKKAVSRKENGSLTIAKNVSRKRGAHLPSADYNSEEEIEEPDKKKKKGSKKETKQKPDENTNEDEVEEEEKKPTKTEKKTKQTKTDKEVTEMKESDTEESEEPEKNKKKETKKVTKQKSTETSSKDNVEEQKKPKKAEKKTKQTEEDKEATEVEEDKPKKKATQTKDKDVPEKAKSTKGSKTEKKETDKKSSKKTNDEKTKPDKEKKTAEKKEKPAKKEPAKKKVAGDTEKKVNSTETDWEKIDFGSDKKNALGDDANLKITSWNVDGLRAWVKKEGMNIFKYGAPDVLCLQETKCSEELLPSEITDLEGYEKFWCSSDKNGYAGVGLLTKEKPIEVIYGIDNEEHDSDGRCVTVEFEKYYLVTVYVPNAGRKLVTLDKRLEWNEAFKKFIKDLDQKKPVIICGDMNVAHNEIDLKNPKTNTKNAGFTVEEREGMTDFLEEGFVDTFRALYPDKTDCYTFWTYMMNSRKKNVGWRLDYFLVSERIKDKVCDNVIHDKVLGSDHCPVTLFVNI